VFLIVEVICGSCLNGNQDILLLRNLFILHLISCISDPSQRGFVLLGH
jgi:hypothetical protein